MAENRVHPYSIGIAASIPFETIAVYGPPMFQRGILLAYFPSLDLYVTVVHLHAHSSEKREQEAEALLRVIRNLLDSNKKLIVTGDFNSLSPLDQLWYDKEGLLAFYKRMDNPVFTRMVTERLTLPIYNIVMMQTILSQSSSFDSQRKKYCTRGERPDVMPPATGRGNKNTVNSLFVHTTTKLKII